MNTGGSDSYNRMKAKTAIRRLVLAVMALGYAEPKAIEIVECLVEEAGRDGLNTKYLWNALDVVAPIPKSE
jgi:hypothetical protein